MVIGKKYKGKIEPTEKIFLLLVKIGIVLLINIKILMYSRIHYYFIYILSNAFILLYKIVSVDKS